MQLVIYFSKYGVVNCNVSSVAITKYFFTKYFTLNTFFEKSTSTKYFVNFGI